MFIMMVVFFGYFFVGNLAIFPSALLHTIAIDVNNIVDSLVIGKFIEYSEKHEKHVLHHKHT